MSEANTEAIGEPMQPVDQTGTEGGRAVEPCPIRPASPLQAELEEIDKQIWNAQYRMLINAREGDDYSCGVILKMLRAFRRKRSILLSAAQERKASHEP